MEPTPHASRTTTAQDSTPDRLARWDGDGTVYQLPQPPTPRPAPPVTVKPEPVADHDEDLLEREPAFPPPRRSVMPWALFGSVLLIATALTLWKPWAIENNATRSSPPPAEPTAVSAAAPVAAEPATPAPPETTSATTLEESAEGENAYIVRPAEKELAAEPPAVMVTPEPEPEPAQSTALSAAEAPDADAEQEQTPALIEPQPPAAEAVEAVEAAATVPASTASTPAKALGASGKPASARGTAAKTKAPAAATQGTLVVAVKPWGEVWVDGKRRGISPPLIRLELPAGRHEIELRNPGLPSHTQSVEISAGQALNLQHRFQ
ncbi:hypothetical protein HNP46_001635 [Pseudomonas nitritireducens]|uniref:PEGA domain-containing protein n=1 Tax=Pseudomonas nitroreducens TaxID=46680 RepID=A0A7W7NZR8_PSENT|nr:PEGA domain-containing protein [Pseudomonas nitritireducens]MBB4862791.1 hypothetical protein [Pseudomonas nitritireducens]